MDNSVSLYLSSTPFFLFLFFLFLLFLFCLRLAALLFRSLSLSLSLRSLSLFALLRFRSCTPPLSLFLFLSNSSSFLSGLWGSFASLLFPILQCCNRYSSCHMMSLVVSFCLVLPCRVLSSMVQHGPETQMRCEVCSVVFYRTALHCTTLYCIDIDIEH